MGRTIRLLVCLSMVGAAACVPGVATGPEPIAPVLETQAAPIRHVITVPLSGAETAWRGRTICFPHPEPLYIVDGVETTANELADIEAADIVSIQVLKDAAAPVYGARGARDVIIVTTKRGDAAAAAEREPGA
jgi:TonB-dependent SusC/RagA subfamily outer membrane receptor